MASLALAQRPLMLALIGASKGGGAENSPVPAEGEFEELLSAACCSVSGYARNARHMPLSVEVESAAFIRRGGGGCRA